MPGAPGGRTGRQRGAHLRGREGGIPLRPSARVAAGGGHGRGPARQRRPRGRRCGGRVHLPDHLLQGQCRFRQEGLRQAGARDGGHVLHPVQDDVGAQQEEEVPPAHRPDHNSHRAHLPAAGVLRRLVGGRGSEIICRAHRQPYRPGHRHIDNPVRLQCSGQGLALQVVRQGRHDEPEHQVHFHDHRRHGVPAVHAGHLLRPGEHLLGRHRALGPVHHVQPGMAGDAVHFRLPDGHRHPEPRKRQDRQRQHHRIVPEPGLHLPGGLGHPGHRHTVHVVRRQHHPRDPGDSRGSRRLAGDSILHQQAEDPEPGGRGGRSIPSGSRPIAASARTWA